LTGEKREVATMTEKTFDELCRVQDSGTSILLSYLDFQLTGKLVGCWESEVLIDINGQFELWPRELCQVEKQTYPIPSYA
jgi:hypothetical protein